MSYRRQSACWTRFESLDAKREQKLTASKRAGFVSWNPGRKSVTPLIQFMYGFRNSGKSSRSCLFSLFSGNSIWLLLTRFGLSLIPIRADLGFLLISLWWFTSVIVAADDAISVRRGSSRIDAADLKRHVSTLSSDAFEGREAGARGGKAAVAYLRSELSALRQTCRLPREMTQDFGRDFQNLLILLPGSDERLKGEVIVVFSTTFPFPRGIMNGIDLRGNRMRLTRRMQGC